MKKLTGTLLGLASLAAPNAGVPATEKAVTAENPAKASELVDRLPERQRLRHMDLQYWPWDTFHEDFSQQIITLSNAHGPERPEILLNLAEIYLTQMMLYEARSVLEGIKTANSLQETRRLVMLQAIDLLQGDPLEDPDTTPLLSRSRPDRAFWLSLHAIAVGDGPMLDENLVEGFIGMAHLPKPVLRVVLPLFIEAAVALDKKTLASEAIRLIDELPDLSTAPTGFFLLGRVAELKGNEKTALDAYFEASKGWDRSAARARLALADMALRDKGRGALLAARDVLAHGADSWRGDNYELEALEKLASVYTKLGDAKGALQTYGKINVRFPVSNASEEARANGTELLGKVYQQGADGEIPLAVWVDVHLKILPLYKEYPAFSEYVEILADKALSLGGSSLARSEYQRALLLLEQNFDYFNIPVPEEQKHRLLLKLARAQNMMGDLAEARDTLDRIDVKEGGSFRDDVFALKAEILAEMGDRDRFMRTYVANPDAEQLRNMARAFLDLEDWGGAIKFYERLKSEFPDQFLAEDASYLLIAAKRQGNLKIEEQIVADFPGLTASREWIDLAKGLQEVPADLLPLRKDSAQSRLNSLDRALEKIEKSGL